VRFMFSTFACSSKNYKNRLESYIYRAVNVNCEIAQEGPFVSVIKTCCTFIPGGVFETKTDLRGKFEGEFLSMIKSKCQRYKMFFNL
jgi:hypothetical protein